MIALRPRAIQEKLLLEDLDFLLFPTRGSSHKFWDEENTLFSGGFWNQPHEATPKVSGAGQLSPGVRHGAWDGGTFAEFKAAQGDLVQGKPTSCQEQKPSKQHLGDLS